MISEHSQFLNAKKRCRTAEHDEEYCLGRGKCYENTDMCRYCYIWTCRKDARKKVMVMCKNTKQKETEACKEKIQRGRWLSPAYTKKNSNKHK